MDYPVLSAAVIPTDSIQSRQRNGIPLWVDLYLVRRHDFWSKRRFYHLRCVSACSLWHSEFDGQQRIRLKLSSGKNIIPGGDGIIPLTTDVAICVKVYNDCKLHSRL